MHLDSATAGLWSDGGGLALTRKRNGLAIWRRNGGFGLDFGTVARLVERGPGTYSRCNSCDTHALGMIIARATRQSVAEYLEATLWHPLGMEDDAFFMVDGHGVEASGMGVNVTLRDFAKLGQMMHNRGEVNHVQMQPEGWWNGCAKPAAPHLMPGRRDSVSLWLWLSMVAA